MRFIIEEVLMDSIHPQWPGEIFWKIKDRKLDQYRLGMYTTQKAASLMVEKVKQRYSTKVYNYVGRLV